MLENIIRVAWRQLLRRKIFTLLNILGLSLGLSACITIFAIIRFEFSFDSFYPGKNRIYRVMGDIRESTGDLLHFARVPPALSLQARPVLEDLESMAAVVPYPVKIKVPQNNPNPVSFDSRLPGTHLSTTAFAEPQYFDIFPDDWLAGDPRSALAAPFRVVITRSRAFLYFGNLPVEQVLGKRLIYDDSLTVTVSGVIKDRTGNSDLPFTDFLSFSSLQSPYFGNAIALDNWQQPDLSAWLFIKLKPGAGPGSVQAGLNRLAAIHSNPSTHLSFRPEPLADIHFDNNIIENPIRTAHRPTLYALGGIALFILLLAIINFINLSTALSIRRAREMAVRKILGSGLLHLRLQLLLETLLLAIISVVPAALLVNPILRGFGDFLPPGISFDLLQPYNLLYLLLFTLATALLAGSYPAILLAATSPIENLQAAGRKGSGNWWIRKGLIVFQFAVSLVFIMASLVISAQLRYAREKDLGFRTDAILTVETPRGAAARSIRVFAEKTKQLASVNAVAREWLPPMSENPRGMKLKLKATDQKDFWVTQIAGDESFITLYGIKLLAGRNLEKADSVKELLINERLAHYMGCRTAAEAIGKFLYWNDQPYPIVGVVADFHSHSLHDPIDPLCIINRPSREGSLAVRLHSAGRTPNAVHSTLVSIEKIWKQIYPASSFNFKFFDESLAKLYEKDRQAETLVDLSTVITVFISCMGLFGLSLFAAEKRAREFSIRKLLGASTLHIAGLMVKEIITLLTIAFLLASPLSWYFMNRWLEGFAYHIPVNPILFVVAGMIGLTFAGFSVGLQVIRSALIKPVDRIRSEQV